MENKELLENLGIDLKNIKTSGKCLCPQCSHTRKKKTDPCLSVDVMKGMYNCHNCSWSGYVTKPEERSEKVFFVPEFKNRTEVSEKTVSYFFKRGISQQTLIDFGVTQSEEWMPQTGKTENCINFNYFRSAKLVNIKFRDARKNFKLVKDAELIMYNLDRIVDTDEVVICEGEIDAMSWHEAGVKNVVSVPNGASKNQKLEYIDNCYKYFEGKKKIYLSTDNDEPGIALRDELSRRLGIEKCFKVTFNGLKDANEFLIAHGSEQLAARLSDAQPFPLEGVFTINDSWGDVMSIYDNGMPTGDKTGDPQLDEHVGFMPGELTMVTGVPSHGKSIYLDQVSLGLAKHSNWNFGICSPESFPLGFYFTRLIKRITGRKFSANNIKMDELLKVKDWIGDRYNMIMPEEGFSLESILDKAKHLVLRKGIKGLIIDPWNRIESTIPAGYNENKFISEQLLKIIKFARANQVHVFLVAHPTKMQKAPGSDNYIVPNLYSISGSAHFFNMTQNGLTVYRNYETGMTEIHIQKVKWEHLGKIGMLEYSYNENNARFVGPGIEPDLSWIEEDRQQLQIQSAIRPSELWDKEEKECPF
jgi:twinkle protein